ncbi:MAG: hypothetical protein AAB071_07390 [Bacteroidota bacterium]
MKDKFLRRITKLKFKLHSKRIYLSLKKKVFITLICFSIFLLSCKKENVSQYQNDIGNYIFVERLIVTDAVLLDGDSTKIRPQCVEPSMFYSFDVLNQVLKYKSGENETLPITKELKMIFGDKQVLLAPFAGCNGGSIWLTPIYYLPLWIDNSLAVVELLSNRGNEGTVGLKIEGIPNEIILSPDSIFTHVSTHIEFIEQIDGDTATLQFKDSLVIKNFGSQPKEKVFWTKLGS